jgi:tRNA uridine 5-carboxymethylaminomethyl modification enzyme
LAQLSAVWPEFRSISNEIAGHIETEGLYAYYLERQERDIEAFRRDEHLALPRDIDYETIGGLSTEARQRLAGAQPETLGAASRISGVTPAALVALLRHVKRDEVQAP